MYGTWEKLPEDLRKPYIDDFDGDVNAARAFFNEIMTDDFALGDGELGDDNDPRFSSGGRLSSGGMPTPQEQKELKEWQESQDGTVSLDDKPEVAVEVEEPKAVTTKKGK
jgi:hypothetical protein